MQKKGKRRFFKEEDDLLPQPSFKFDAFLGDYISLKDLVGLPTTNFLPSIETLALLDRAGRRHDQAFMQPVPMLQGVPAVDIVAKKSADNIAGDSNGAVEAVVLGCLPLKNSNGPTPIDISSDNNNDECKIMYNIPGSSMQRTGGKMNPPVRSIANIVVKTKPSSPWEPNSPILWGDVITQEEGTVIHNSHICCLTMYTPKTVVPSVTNITSTSMSAD